MRSLLVAVVLAVALVGPGSLASAPAATALAANTGSIGDSCLVGEWHSGAQTYLTRFHGVIQQMRGLRGTEETNGANGASTTTWAISGPAHGWLLGHKVREVVRGYATSVAHARNGQLSFTQNIAHHVVERFTYRGHTSVRHIDGHFRAERSTYTCTDESYATATGMLRRISALD